MPKPFANSPQFNGDIIESYILGIQIGTNKDDSGLPQMMYVKASKLRAFMREGMASVYNYRGEFSVLPTDLAVGDTFYAASSFSEGGNTYLAGHLYAYNGTSWDDITNIFTQYAQQTEVDSINERLTEAEEKIDALSGFIFKGDTTRDELPDASASNQGWVYYLTDESIYVASDGSDWVTVMNYVVQTITEGDTTHAPSADAVYKALAQRDAKDADLQSQIVNTNAELDNVEALIGGDAQVENTDPTEGESLLAQSRLIHHANMLPNGEFGRVGARAVAWNQLCPNGNFANTDYWTSRDNDPVSISNNVLTVAASSGSLKGLAMNENPIKAVARHKYLLMGYVNSSVAGTASIAFANYYGSHTISANQWTFVARVFEQSNSEDTQIYFLVMGSFSGGETLQYKNVMAFDLTTMQEVNTTADQFRAKFPATYYPNNNGQIIPLNPTGFRIRGINLWDEETESGYIGSTGSMVSDANSLRSKNFCNCKPNTEYYFLKPSSYSQTPNICWYDSDKNFIERSTATGFPVLTSPNNACYFKLSMYAYGSTYQNNVQIADNSLPTSVKTVYHSYDGHVVDTPQIADGHYVNENCYDYVENVVEDGVIKGKKHTVVGSVDLSTLIFGVSDGIYYAQIPDLKEYSLIGICDKYTVVNKNAPDLVDGEMNCGYNANYIQIKTSSSPTGTLYYQKASESVADCEPLRSFGISDYSTVEPITPQTELVNRIDVPFSVKTISANTLIEQITQNTADIAEEKATRTAQVSALDKRVTNLELKTGDQFDVDYPSSTYGMNGVPSNVEPYAKVTKLRGVTRAKNNYCYDVASTFTVSGVTFTNNGDGSVTLSGTASSAISQQIWTNYIPFKANHFYFIGGLRAVSGIQYGVRGFVINNASDFVWSYTADWTNCLAITIQSGTNCNGITLKPTVTDLNTYFGTNDLSFLGATDSAKLATILTDYPSLLEYSSYDVGSLVDTEYEGVKGVGNNRMSLNGFEAVTSANVTFTPTFNSEGELEYITATGTSNASGNFDILRYDDFHLPVGTYFLGFGANSLFNDILAYVNGTWVTLNRNGGTITVTDPSQAIWVRGRFASGVAFGGAKLYPKVNIGSTELPFSPYSESTLYLPSPLALRSAGSVAEEAYLNEDGEAWKTNPIGEIDMGSLNIYAFGDSYPNKFYAEIDGCVFTNVPTGSADGICPVYNASASDLWTLTDKSFTLGSLNVRSNLGSIMIHDSSFSDAQALKTYLTGKKLYYRLATPNAPTQLTPILDPYAKVEPNGTIETVQSQSPKVDGAMTVEYMAS